MRWSFDGWTQRPLDNVHYKYWEAGDPFFLYPGDKGTDLAFRSSPRYELLKEGIRDINKAKYLMARSATARAKVSALLDSLQRPPKEVNAWGATLLIKEASRQQVISETRRMKDGINQIARDSVAGRM